MSEDFHFGQPRNDLICSCRRHYGVGEWSPERRAAVYARMRDALPSLLNESRRAYLDDFEATHGRVRYTMGVVDTNSGNVRKEDKGKPVQGPIFDTLYDLARERAA